MRGPATLTFSDGQTFEVYCDSFSVTGAHVKSGTGVASSDRVFEIGMKTGQARFECGDIAFNVVITASRGDGTLTFKTSGPPLR